MATAVRGGASVGMRERALQGRAAAPPPEAADDGRAQRARRLGRVDRPQQLRAARLGPQQPHEHHGGERGEQQRPRAEILPDEAGGRRVRVARNEDLERIQPGSRRAAAERRRS